jgi:hypothetical protein
MPACPVCGATVRETAWFLHDVREDDGRKKVCEFGVLCDTDGALTRWADREDDPWRGDATLTELWFRRIANR